ncbi:MAG TPA: exodeoxyribonuclease V subunit gamma [Nocardioidaceae bacterium]|nr:exodeoxyribonuclease V subunit gamma [Nocardioidaceae bacterium]
MLTVHRSERADRLVDGLAELLADPPDDPFTPDVVAVPSKGVERWISQRLSSVLGAQRGRGDGVCANVVFASPRRIVAQVVAASVGVDADADPWSERRLTWPLLDVIDASVGEEWCAALGRYLRRSGHDDDHALGRRLAVAQKLAGLFASYAAQRPGMIQDWIAGDDTDGAGALLEPDLKWQAEIWRRLRQTVGVDSPAERIDAAVAAVRDRPEIVDLPARVSMFGPTRLTSDQLAVIGGLAAARDVHLWLPHPSDGLWQRVSELAPGEPVRRIADTAVDVAQHPLGQSLARDAREMQQRLAARVTIHDDRHLAAPDPPDTLLGRLQRDIQADAMPGASLALSPADRSIQVHACHGRQRQVEVLREAILGALQDDPSLELRDMIVMCPDIEAFAPLITAAFGLADDDAEQAHPGHRLRVRLADRSVRQTNPVLSVLAALLELAEARLTASQVLDLAAMPPVRARFGFDDESLERVGDWVRRSGVRWGLDADARRRYHLERTPQNTWRAGLDRILLGATMDEDDLRTVGLALPLDDVDSNEVALAGRLAEFVDRLGRIVERLQRRQSPQEWSTVLLAAVDEMTDVGPLDAWQLSQARWQVSDALAAAGDRADQLDLRLADIRALLADRLRGRPTRANFRTGHLTMCTMVPMRSVPHRVVCLLGLDDGAYPRGSGIDGDDILERTPLVGERDRRSEDRQLLLDAILAARDRLIVVYTGADERTGVERPPAVPLGELLDVLDQTAHPVTGRVRDQVVVRHPLQPFDARNFTAGALGDDDPFSFDSTSYDGALAILGERVAAPPFLTGPLSEAEPIDALDVDTLVRFLEDPVRGFLRNRLGLAGAADDDEPADSLPIEVDALEAWEIGDRLLAAGLDGIPRDRAVRAEWLRGQLPPGSLGVGQVEPIASRVQQLVDQTEGLRSGDAGAVDVAIDLESGVRLFGTVTGVHDTRIVRIVYSRLGPKHRLRSWVQYLALAAAMPERDWATATVGRARGGDGMTMSCITGVAADEARATLDALIALYLRGLREPLPMPPGTAFAYADARRQRTPAVAVKKAASQWRRKFNDRDIGEFDSPDNRQVWGAASLDDLLAAGPDPSLGVPSEPHLFGQLARLVWDPLLAAETEYAR